ncbi:MAG: D-tyrosyl-tRNA(Tyr) deacylase [Deltaproteobacteria bacterium]|nr:D-tyrosyl-tRNA(Tyr) deacylase [Deltaproteobacteria bacterium]
MKVVLQRVTRAEVRVQGHEPESIGQGLLLLVGIADGDREAELEWMARKIAGLRVFRDDEGRMNLSVTDVGGRCLAVSQFTLLGDCRKGKRPSFLGAMEPENASMLFDRFVALLEAQVGARVATGVFGAMMDVELVNDGPVTLILERTPDG